MKLLLSLIILFSATVCFAGADNAFEGDGTVKTRRTIHTFVKNTEGSSVSDGEVLCHDTSEDDGISAAYCSALGDRPYCVVDDTSGCADDALCKCLIEGYKSNVQFDGSGDNATAGGKLYGDINGDAAAQTTPSTADFVIGVALDAASASGDLEAYIKL